MPEWATSALEVLAALVEGVGFAILAFTAAKFVFRYVAFEIERVRGFDCAKRFRDIRLELGSHIVLAIDFMVIADIVHTALVNTQESLLTLGLFVLIRSVLAFFLGLDMKDLREEQLG